MSYNLIDIPYTNFQGTLTLPIRSNLINLNLSVACFTIINYQYSYPFTFRLQNKSMQNTTDFFHAIATQKPSSNQMFIFLFWRVMFFQKYLITYIICRVREKNLKSRISQNWRRDWAKRWWAGESRVSNEPGFILLPPKTVNTRQSSLISAGEASKKWTPHQSRRHSCPLHYFIIKISTFCDFFGNISQGNFLP